MKCFMVLFTGHHKGSNGKDMLMAARYKRDDSLYIFYDVDGNTIAQYETRNVVGVRELPPDQEAGT